MNVVDAWFVCKCTRIADRCSANVYASCVGQTALDSKVFLQKQVGKAQNKISHSVLPIERCSHEFRKAALSAISLYLAALDSKWQLVIC